MAERGGVIIQTPRLQLRLLTDADMEPYLAMAAEPEVTRYVSPTPIPRASAEAAATHYRRLLETKGYGYWAIEVKGGASFAGIALLQDVKFTAAFTPAIEVGWLLPREHWGNGYATEGGRAALHYAFTTMKLDRVVALTAASNIPSRRRTQAPPERGLGARAKAEDGSWSGAKDRSRPGTKNRSRPRPRHGSMISLASRRL